MFVACVAAAILQGCHDADSTVSSSTTGAVVVRRESHTLCWMNTDKVRIKAFCRCDPKSDQGEGRIRNRCKMKVFNPHNVPMDCSTDREYAPKGQMGYIQCKDGSNKYQKDHSFHLKECSRQEFDDRRTEMEDLCSGSLELNKEFLFHKEGFKRKDVVMNERVFSTASVNHSGVGGESRASSFLHVPSTKTPRNTSRFTNLMNIALSITDLPE